MFVQRRSFLKGLGLAGLVPLLPSDFARADGSTGPKRLVVLTFPNGVEPSFFPVPGSTRNDFEFGWISEDLNAYRDRLTALGGVSVAGAPHNTGGHWVGSMLLTGGQTYGANANGPSIDHVVANSMSAAEGDDIRPLPLGIQPRSDQPQWRTRMSWVGSGEADTPFLSPASAAEAIFSNAEATPGDDVALERRISVLDRVTDDLRRYEQGLDSEDRHHLQAHLSAVESLQGALVDQAGLDCSAPDIGDEPDNGGNRAFPQLTDAYLQIVAHALRCDATRVVNLFFGDTQGGDNIRYPWLSDPSAPEAADYPWIPEANSELVSSSDHALAHPEMSPNSTPEELRHFKSIRDRWWAGRLARLLDLLDVPEGTGSMLDNTVVLFASTMDDGDRHATDNLPWIVAGGAGLGLQHNQYLEYGRGGLPQTRVLGTIAAALGHPLQNFGSAGGDTTPIEEMLP